MPRYLESVLTGLTVTFLAASVGFWFPLPAVYIIFWIGTGVMVAIMAAQVELHETPKEDDRPKGFEI